MTQLKIIMALWWAKCNPAIAVIMSVKLVCDGYNLGHRRWLHAAWIRPPISRVSSRENLRDLMCTYSIYIHTVSLRKILWASDLPNVYPHVKISGRRISYASTESPRENLWTTNFMCTCMYPHVKISGPWISCMSISTWKSLGRGRGRARICQLKFNFRGDATSGTDETNDDAAVTKCQGCCWCLYSSTAIMHFS